MRLFCRRRQPGNASSLPDGGNRDVVQDGLNGFLCDLTDIDSFEKALRSLLTSDEELVSMKRESRRLAEKFDVHAIGSRFERIFEASVR